MINSLFSKLTILLAAALFSQFPAFENSYTQRLGGHIDELRYQVELTQEIAKQSGKTLDEFIAKFIANADEDFQRQGLMMQGNKLRLTALENALYSLHSAHPFTRPFLFLIHSDKVIAKATLHNFHPSIPLTVESLFFALIGAFLGYFIFSLITSLFHAIKKSLPIQHRFR